MGDPRTRTEGLGILVKTTAVVAVLVGLKIVVHSLDYEPITLSPLFSGVMGSVIFTLAILLAGTLSDFKESERIVGELASQLRRIHTDLQTLLTSPAALAETRGHLRGLVAAINRNFQRGDEWKMGEIHPHIDAIDRAIAASSAAGGHGPSVRTNQVWLHNVLRIVERLEVIIETSFVRAGYYLAATVVTFSLVGLLLTRLEPFYPNLLLVGFAAFVIVGLLILIADLDNPFAGDARIHTVQMTKLERFMDAAKPPV
ncbi:MAG: hypothetical protein HYT80_06260 [Euryarchaeota archaeon]|nr:hypothetical protein [Euryarchaeota archaeon]